MHLHLDPVGGAAGDMFIAAILDAFPDLADGMLQAIRQAGLPAAVGCRLVEHKDHALTGRRFVVDEPGALSGPAAAHRHPPSQAHAAGHGQDRVRRHAPGHGHGHDHDHGHAPGHGHAHEHGHGREPAQDHEHPQADDPGHEHHHDHGHGHGHGHDHGHEPPHGGDGPQAGHLHVPFAALRADLQAAPLEDSVKRHALAIFTLLAQAEARVHGATVDTVTFHEVGAWDSVADIVGAAYLIDALDRRGGATWSLAPLPLGSGRVRSAHGMLPVPAPAALLLMQGYAMRGDDLEGERVTPTGAAILRHLECRSGIGDSPLRLAGSGTGFGLRRFPGISNVLRVLVFEPAAPAGAQRDRVDVLEFEVDDQSPEDLAIGLEHVRGVDGVIDVHQSPVFAKKGRMGAHVRVLCRPQAREAAIDACFAQTTTLGVRLQSQERRILPRSASSVSVAGREHRVKTAVRPTGAATVKAEIDDLARHAHTHAERQALRSAAERTGAEQDHGD